MTALEFALVLIVGFAGFCSAVILLVACCAWMIRRHHEEHAFRRELRKAQELEERFERRMANKAQAQAFLDAFDESAYEQQVAERASRQ